MDLGNKTHSSNNTFTVGDRSSQISLGGPEYVSMVICNSRLYIDSKKAGLNTGQDKTTPEVTSRTKSFTLLERQSNDNPRNSGRQRFRETGSREIINGYIEPAYVDTPSTLGSNGKAKHRPYLPRTAADHNVKVCEYYSDGDIRSVSNKQEVINKINASPTQRNYTTQSTSFPKQKHKKSVTFVDHHLTPNTKMKFNTRDKEDSDYIQKKETQDPESKRYYHPMFQVYNQDVKYHIEKVKRLRQIVKQLAQARERENNFINSLVRKCAHNYYQTLTDPSKAAFDWREKLEVMDDNNNKSTSKKQSNLRRATQNEIIDRNSTKIIQPSGYDQSQSNEECINIKAFAINNKIKDYALSSISDASGLTMSTPTKSIYKVKIIPNIIQEKVVCNKSMFFPTSSVAILQCENNEYKPQKYTSVYPVAPKLPISNDLKHQKSPVLEIKLNGSNKTFKSKNNKARPPAYKIMCHNNVNTDIVNPNYYNDYVSVVHNTGDINMNTEASRRSYDENNHKSPSYRSPQHLKEPISMLQHSTCDGNDTECNYMLYHPQQIPFSSETICYPTSAEAPRYMKIYPGFQCNHGTRYSASIITVRKTNKPQRGRSSSPDSDACCHTYLPSKRLKCRKNTRPKVRKTVSPKPMHRRSQCSHTTQTEVVLKCLNLNDSSCCASIDIDIEELPPKPASINEEISDKETSDDEMFSLSDYNIPKKKDTKTEIFTPIKEQAQKKCCSSANELPAKSITKEKLSDKNTKKEDPIAKFMCKTPISKYCNELCEDDSRISTERAYEKLAEQIARLKRRNNEDANKSLCKKSEKGKREIEKEIFKHSDFNKLKVEYECEQNIFAGKEGSSFLNGPSFTVAETSKEDHCICSPKEDLINYNHVKIEKKIEKVKSKPQTVESKLHTEQTEADTNTKSKKEYEKNTQKVAQLRSRNQENRKCLSMTIMENKLDNLITSVNALIVQLRHRKEEYHPANHKNTNNVDKETQKQKCVVTQCYISASKDYVSQHEDIPQADHNYTTSSATIAAQLDSDPVIKENKGMNDYQKQFTRIINTLYIDKETMNTMMDYGVKKPDFDTPKVQTPDFGTGTKKAFTLKNHNTQLEEIMKKEMGKSDRAKRDIEDILNGEYRSQALQIDIDMPTKERSTEITASLSKTAVKPFCSYGVQYLATDHSICPPMSDERTMQVEKCKCLANLTTDNMISLGVMGLIKLSTLTISRLVAFVQGQYLTPMTLVVRHLGRTNQFVCSICNTVFSNSKEFTDHLQRRHVSFRDRDCCVCRHMLDVSAMRSSGHTGLFTCRHCGKVFTRAYCRELHQQTCPRRAQHKPSVDENLSLLR